MDPHKDHTLRISERRVELTRLRGILDEIRREMLALEKQYVESRPAVNETYRASARNLLHYLAFRRHDLRDLQTTLASLGLSSLGRSEPEILPSVEAVLAVIKRLTHSGGDASSAWETVADFAESRGALDRHTVDLLGPEPKTRQTRIMVTMPTEAASDPSLIRTLLNSGMDCMRINCAHDGPMQWKQMIDRLRAAEKELGRQCRVLMDLAGPKIRTGSIEQGPKVVKWKPRRRDHFGRVLVPARIALYANARVTPTGDFDAAIPLSGSLLADLKIGDNLLFRDARDAHRQIDVRERLEGVWIAEATETAYVTPGLAMIRRRSGDRAIPLIGHVGDLPAINDPLVVRKGEPLLLTVGQLLGRPAVLTDTGRIKTPAQIGCTDSSVFRVLKPGDRVWFDDGKLGGRISAVLSEGVLIQITHAPTRGFKLYPDKGINFPDSDLPLPPLMPHDLEHLPFVAAHADIVGYSFVRSASDIEELEKQLRRLGAGHLGIVLKIETRAAFENLPELLLASMFTPRDGVMIARGDLAIECGFERLAELQEEILWMCEAAHIPVIWATQVLEGLTKLGQPSRAEISDAAIAQRAECVMLNKGDHIVEAVFTLDDILRRMQGHQRKKRALLRPLELARRFKVDG